jgi:hypothetical protein
MMVKEVDDDMWGSKNDNGNKYGILINWEDLNGDDDKNDEPDKEDIGK